MKKRLTLILFAVILCMNMNASIAKSEREKYNFNSNWKVLVGNPKNAEQENFQDDNWKKVTIPYAWNEDDAFRLAIHEIRTGIAWYRKQFTLPLDKKDKKIILEFEGLRQAGEVYINGKKMILHENGVMAFGIDITNVVYFGDKANTIAVKTDNSWDYKEKESGVRFQWNDKNFNVPYGGLTKNIILHITPKVYQTLPLYNNLGTTGVYIYPSDINIEKKTAVINAESEVKNESDTPKRIRYSVSIKDMDDKQIASFSRQTKTVQPGETITLTASKKVSNLNFWSWGYGYLYTVTTSLSENNNVIDAVETKTGFRKTHFGDGLVKLNDRVIQLKGYAQRTSNEWPAIGLSVPAWLSDYSNSMIIKGNGNFVRWMHVTPWKQDVESSDRVGLIQVMPAGDSEKDVFDHRWEQRKQLMRDAIIYNKNNPSILFYECGNESISEEHMAEMKSIRDKYDPKGGRSIGSREMLDIDIAEWGGEMLYINKSAKHPMFATEYCRDEGLRKYWDSYSFPYHREGAGPLHRGADASIYNHNQDMFAVELIRRWFDYYEARPGTGTRVSSGGAKIIFSDSNTHFRGEENYRRSGVTDPMRIPKDAYFTHEVMWDGWVDLDNYHTHIIGHWNYPHNGTKDRSTVKDIYVVSAAPVVKLFLNDKSIGEAVKTHQFLNTFKDITYEPGTLVAISYDENGKELSNDKLETVGNPVAIRMQAITSPNGMLADGADLALIEVEVVDSEGRRCPLNNDVINFEIDGPAEWRGGIAQGPDNFILSKRLPVECGVNRVLVRSTTQSGKITVKASSGILTPATIQIETTPITVNSGLGELFPGNNLPSYLEKGPTPKSPSFKTSRIAIPIKSATAGSNQDIVSRSYDDNELSEWHNDGRLNNAWITYKLNKKANINQVCMKLTGFRRRSYPIEIYAGKDLVWSGMTEKSLGYTTVGIKETNTDEITIKLKGSTEESEAFSQIIELVQPVANDMDLLKAKDGDKTGNELRIIEIEFYEKAK